MKFKATKQFLLAVVSFVLLISLSGIALAAEVQDGTDWVSPVTYVKIVAVFIVALSLLITLIPPAKELAHTHKTFFFLLFVIPIVLSSLYMAGHTIYENVHSDTKGPVHWHADYEVWFCNEKVDLIDPTGLKNKIGTPLFHEHNDDRIHIEGTVMQLEDVDLGSYFEVIDGELTSTKISFNIEERGIVTYENGDACPDGSIGEVGVYVNGARIEDPQHYLIAPEVFVPNGDCIIFEFGANLQDTTTRICPSWEANGMTYEEFAEIKEAMNRG